MGMEQFETNKFFCEFMVEDIFPTNYALLAKMLMERHGYSQKEAALRVRVTQPAVSHYLKKLEDTDHEIVVLCSENIKKCMGPVEEFLNTSFSEDKIPEFDRLCEKVRCEACRLTRTGGLIKHHYCGCCDDNGSYFIMQRNPGEEKKRPKTLCRTMVEDIFPSIRAIIAQELIEEYEYSQSCAAAKLGMTQPAISQYRSRLRGKKAEKILRNSKAMDSIKDAASKIHRLNLTLAENEINTERERIRCELCAKIRDSGILPRKYILVNADA